MIDENQFDEALDRIARTPDGVLLYRFLQTKLMGTIAEHAPKQSALRVEHGERRFAQMLMARMAKGIDESGGRTDLSNSRASERTVVIRRGAQPVRTGQRLSARDFLRANDTELRHVASLTADDSSSGA